MGNYAIGYKHTSKDFTDASQIGNGKTAFNLACGDIITGFIGSVSGNIHCSLAVATHCQGSKSSFTCSSFLVTTKEVLSTRGRITQRNSSIGLCEVAGDIPENLTYHLSCV